MTKLNVVHACGCEHIAHLDQNLKTPSGNQGHELNAEFDHLIAVITVHGAFDVCTGCVMDCIRSKNYPL